MESHALSIIVAIGTFFVAACLAAFGVALLKTVATIDVPNERSSHARPTPRGGGAAIAGVTLIGSVAIWLAAREMSTARMVFVVAASVIALIGWLDDVRSLSPWTRLAVHFVAAVSLVLTLGTFETVTLPFIGPVSVNPTAGMIITIGWLVGLTNTFNFMDGIDGIAGAQGATAGAFWYVTAATHGDFATAVFALLLCATTIGFLLHNWAPATIFMGDVGSSFLGFCYAAIPLVAHPRVSTLPLVSLVVLFPFVFDSVLTILRRLRNRERLWHAHRSHLYQRLVIAGWPHRSVTVFYAVIAIIDSLAAVFLDRGMAGAGTVATLTLCASAVALVTVTLFAERSMRRQLT